MRKAAEYARLEHEQNEKKRQEAVEIAEMSANLIEERPRLNNAATILAVILERPVFLKDRIGRDRAKEDDGL